MRHKWRRDVCRDEFVMAAESWVFVELLLNAREDGICSQALGDLSAVSNRKEA